MSLLHDLDRRSLEDPETPLSFEKLAALFGGVNTHAGVRVDERSALNLSIVFACIRNIAETLGSLPFLVLRRLRPRGKRRAPEHELYSVIHDQPNPEMTAITFWETLAAHAVSWGGAFAEKEMRGDGRVVNLWPLPPDRTKVVRIDGAKKVRTWIREKRDAPLKPVLLPMKRVLHIPGLGFDGLNGYSVIGLARQVIGWGKALEEFSARYFGSGTHPDLVFRHENLVTPEIEARLEQYLVPEVLT